MTKFARQFMIMLLAIAVVGVTPEPAQANGPPPSSVTLTSSKTVLGSQDTATLTATSNQPMDFTSFEMIITDTTTGAVLRTCASGGSTCGTTFMLRAGGPDTVNATLTNGSVTYYSNAISISRQPWTVHLTASSQVLDTNQAATLTATANQDTSYTNYDITIFDMRTGTAISKCQPGATCTAVTGPDLTGLPHQYQAYVDTSGKLPGSNVQASSNGIEIHRSPYTVSLSPNSNTVTASSNQPVDYTSYSILIYDTTHNSLLKACSGSSCSVPLDTSISYQAFVGAQTTTAPPNSEQARSGGYGSAEDLSIDALATALASMALSDLCDYVLVIPGDHTNGSSLTNAYIACEAAVRAGLGTAAALAAIAASGPAANGVLWVIGQLSETTTPNVPAPVSTPATKPTLVPNPSTVIGVTPSYETSDEGLIAANFLTRRWVPSSASQTQDNADAAARTCIAMAALNIKNPVTYCRSTAVFVTGRSDAAAAADHDLNVILGNQQKDGQQVKTSVAQGLRESSWVWCS